LINLSRLAFHAVSEKGNEICLGALATHTQIVNSKPLQECYPALVSACREIGAPPVRNRGTLGGNLANASPAADAALPLLIYDAQVGLAGPDGERQLALKDFFLGPGQNRLHADEFIREIRLPRLPAGTAAVFIKLGNRQAMAVAVASVAVRLSLDERARVSQARIALGSVGPTPLRATAAEAAIESYPLTTETIRAAALAAREAATPISDVRATANFRRQMVEVLVRRALHTAWGQLARR
jgi:carbon-monoxide dehydrogenase medium subunit